MPNETLGASFSIDVTELKSGLAQANRMIRESNSEFQAAAAGMDDWSQSEDGLNSKLKNLNTVADLQNKKVDALKSEYERLVADGLDPSSKAAVDLRTQINNEAAALAKTQKEIEKQTDALDNLGKETEDAGSKFDSLKKAGGVAVGAVAAVGAACVAAVGAFLGLAESTREVRTAFAKLETGFETAGLSAENAENTINELYGVVGDIDKANEASAFLGQMANDEQELAQYTNVLTGVYATFGDALPVESLAETINHTAELGTVQGSMADALEWSGVSVDEFNAQLAACNDVEERQQLIVSTLNGLYGEAADAYRENNAEVIAANEAQMALTRATAELGAVAEPIITTLKQLAAGLLETLTPFVSLIGEGLKGAFEGADGAAEQLADGLNGIIDAILEKVTTLVPKVIELVLQLVPKLIETILSQLPAILTMILDVITQVISAIATMLPTIIDQILDIIPKLIDALLAAIPDLLDAAIQLLMAIVDAIPVIITRLLDELPHIIKSLISSLLAAIPKLIKAAIQLLMAIVDAIPVILDALIKNLPQIINTIIDGLLSALPMLLQGAIQLLMAIITAIPTIISVLVEKIPSIVSTIISALLSRLPDLIKGAVQLLMGIVKAIPQIIKELVKQTPTIIKSLVNGLSSGVKDIANVGKNLIKGLWNGISDMVGWIGKKIKGFGESILGGLKSFFGIKSPSRVMADQVGKNLALGIGKGFEDNIAGVNKEIQHAMDIDGGTVSVNAKAGKVSGFGSVDGTTESGGGVTVYQTNNYSQAHSRYELYKSKQQTAAAVRLAMGAV